VAAVETVGSGEIGHETADRVLISCHLLMLEASPQLYDTPEEMVL
jgi:hypothetical protein